MAGNTSPPSTIGLGASLVSHASTASKSAAPGSAGVGVSLVGHLAAAVVPSVEEDAPPDVNWVEVLLVDAHGDGIQAQYELYNKKTGAMVASGKLDANGFARKDLPEDDQALEVVFKNGPKYEPKRTPTNPGVSPTNDQSEMAAKAERLAQLDHLSLA